MSTDAQDSDHPVATGVVKWFDRTKGFGFVVDDCDGADILLNANVLRDFGRSSVGDGARLRVTVVTTSRGKQAQRILDLVPEETSNLQAVSADGPFLPARVKWFDKVRGFGFANVFGSTDDVFVHAETVRRAGLAELQPGEAVAIRAVDGPRGRMASEIADWDRGLGDEGEQAGNADSTEGMIDADDDKGIGPSDGAVGRGRRGLRA